MRPMTLAGLVSLSVFPAVAFGQGAGPDLSRMVVIGDSLSAGFQNGSLHQELQVRGFAAFIAASADVPLDLPLIEAPGIPNVLFLRQECPPVVGLAPGASAGRVDASLQATNLAVPGHDVQDALTEKPDPLFEDLTDLILGLPGLFAGVSASQVEWAEMLQPTTVFIWLGSNDTLVAAIEADATKVTPQAEFESAYAEVMDRMAATGATLVVANIPDVTVIPFLTSAEEVAASIGLPLDALGPTLGIAAGDYVVPDAFDLIAAILGGVISGPLPRDVVLHAAEVATIRQATQAFNAFIAKQAEEKGAVLVDMHRVIGGLDVHGLAVAGEQLTTDYFGGLFSLDGVHPTSTGYAVLANAFIARINEDFGATIPFADVRGVAFRDPLVGICGSMPATKTCRLDREAVASLRSVLRTRVQ